MVAPVPPAPDGFEEPTWVHDTTDVLVVIDRAGFGEVGEVATHPMDRFALELRRTLDVSMNVAAHVITTDEISYAEEIPSQIYAVVTNSQPWAEWGRSWGGNVVEVDLTGANGLIRLRSRGVERTFGTNDVGAAVLFAADEADADPTEDPATPNELGERSVRDVVSSLSIVDPVDGDRAAHLGRAVEPLLGKARELLLDGWWSPDRGHPLGLEDDIQRDIEELERQLRPLSGRPVNGAIVQAFVAQLGDAVLDVASGEALEGERERVESIRTDVLGPVSRPDGTGVDAEAALDVLDRVAEVATWPLDVPSPSVAAADWARFVEYAEANPARTAASLVGWVPAVHAGASSGMTVGGGAGFLAGAVAQWVGAGAAVAGTIGLVFGLVGAVVGAVLGVLAARFEGQRRHRPPP